MRRPCDAQRRTSASNSNATAQHKLVLPIGSTEPGPLWLGLAGEVLRAAGGVASPIRGSAFVDMAMMLTVGRSFCTTRRKASEHTDDKRASHCNKRLPLAHSRRSGALMWPINHSTKSASCHDQGADLSRKNSRRMRAATSSLPTPQCLEPCMHAWTEVSRRDLYASMPTQTERQFLLEMDTHCITCVHESRT